jgi:hypothetical protein
LGGEIGGLDEGGAEAAQLSIERAAGAGGTAADDAQVKRGGFEVVADLVAGRRHARHYHLSMRECGEIDFRC